MTCFEENQLFGLICVFLTPHAPTTCCSGEMSGTGNFLFRANNFLFSTNIIESEFLQSCFIACFYRF